MIRSSLTDEGLKDVSVSINCCGIRTDFHRRLVSQISQDCGNGEGFATPEEQVNQTEGFLSTILKNERRSSKAGGRISVQFYRRGRVDLILPCNVRFDQTCIKIKTIRENKEYLITPQKLDSGQAISFSMQVLRVENVKLLRYSLEGCEHVGSIAYVRRRICKRDHQKYIRRQTTRVHSEIATTMEDQSLYQDEQQILNSKKPALSKLESLKRDLGKSVKLAKTIDPDSVKRLGETKIILEKAIDAIKDAVQKRDNANDSEEKLTLDFHLSSRFQTLADVLRAETSSFLVLVFNKKQDREVVQNVPVRHLTVSC